MTTVSRRTMLTGAAATTAVTAVGSIDATRPAEAATSMDLFLGLSSALTGISVDRLNPRRQPDQRFPRDTLDVKQAYYERAQNYPEFEQLLKLYNVNSEKQDKDAIAKIILDDPNVRFLARSIILAWYLGAWYEPADLKTRSVPPPIPFQVISPTTYTQGFVWRVAQTHPMGYSEWAFGYWSEPPTQSLDDFIK
jgi:Membrane bound FAD containing D-sorbitol dehydrogenase